MQCSRAVAAAVEAVVVVVPVAGGRQSRTLTSAGKSFWNETGLRPPAADRRGKCGCHRWRRKLKSWRIQTCSYRWDTRWQEHTQAQSTLQGYLYLVYFSVLPERGNVIEIRGGSTEADPAHPQGLSCHRPAERGAGVPQWVKRPTLHPFSRNLTSFSRRLTPIISIHQWGYNSDTVYLVCAHKGILHGSILSCYDKPTLSTHKDLKLYLTERN